MAAQASGRSRCSGRRCPNKTVSIAADIALAVAVHVKRHEGFMDAWRSRKIVDGPVSGHIALVLLVQCSVLDPIMNMPVELTTHLSRCHFGEGNLFSLRADDHTSQSSFQYCCTSPGREEDLEDLVQTCASRPRQQRGKRSSAKDTNVRQKTKGRTKEEGGGGRGEEDR